MNVSIVIRNWGSWPSPPVIIFNSRIVDFAQLILILPLLLAILDLESCRNIPAGPFHCGNYVCHLDVLELLDSWDLRCIRLQPVSIAFAIVQHNCFVTVQIKVNLQFFRHVRWLFGYTKIGI